MSRRRLLTIVPVLLLVGVVTMGTAAAMGATSRAMNRAPLTYVQMAQMRITKAQRVVAAERVAAARASSPVGGPSLGNLFHTPYVLTPQALGMPDYFGTIPNYANSPLPSLDTTVDTVVIATGADFPDALCASPLAGAYHSPVLLTQTAALPADVSAEITRLGATHAVIVGGTGAVSTNVFNQLVALLGTGHVTRIAGANRYATAALVAEQVKAVHPLDGTVFVATGLTYPDALAAGPDASKVVRPILLVNGATVPAETTSELASLASTRAVVLGGTGVVPDSAAATVKAALSGPKTLVRLGGTDRYGTASLVASWSAGGEGLDWKMVGIASGQTFADALGGGPAVGRWGGVLLLTQTTSLPAPTHDALTAHDATIAQIRFYGGTDAISAAVRTTILGTVPLASFQSYAGADRYGTAVAASTGSFNMGPLPGTGIRKFVDSLPGLNTPNDLGQQIPVASPNTTAYPGGAGTPASDYYVIALVRYHERLHADLPPTELQGYVQLDPNTLAQVTKPSYLGPAIVAQRNRPVRVKFINELPTGAGGNLFLPVDTTIMGAGMGPDGGSYTQNRASVHLHGGATPWISDGTPHQWTTPAGENTTYTTGVSVRYVPDMDGGHEPTGTLTFYYTNQQSARLMFYHDHAYGITRLNVYAGEAAPYVLQDPVEQKLVNGGSFKANGTTVTVTPSTIPTEQVPLVIQDKTFVPGPSQLASEDPTWDTAHWGGLGNLWFPHVYMPNQTGSLVQGGVNGIGRWDYSPWFYPPLVGLTYGAVPNPLYNGGANGEPALNPGTPNPTIVPEAFMDTPLVNGTAYPFVKVGRKAYRFRVLNACNDRALNLQMYFAKSNGQMWSSDTSTTLLNGDAGEVPMVPANASQSPTWPASWPNDGRDGGVPSPNAAVGAPQFIQIGNEGGFIPSATVLPNTPVGYEYFRRTITVLNVKQHTLLLGPAERADVIVDFSQVPDGSKIVLYNDAPAPMPGFDSRNDYYTNDGDQTLIGGAPNTVKGYGPDTRTIMQFQVSGPAAPAFNLANLRTALEAAYAASQDKPIVPETAYASALATSIANDNYVGATDTSLSFTPLGQSQPATFTLQEKAIIEGFDLDYGRMNAMLGGTLPNLGPGAGGAVLRDYVDPPTEIATDTVPGTLIGKLNDGTQIWRLAHQGVDTHAIHFHLFNVQLINRIAIDGQLFPPDDNELGWKETVRVNPGVDTIVALRPVAPTLPWKLPDSIRPLDPARSIGATWTDSAGDPLTNVMTNFGWEYVWHCHLLGHEENDMMRPFVFEVSPAAPSSLSATQTASGPPQVTATWVDNSTNPAATDFFIQRDTDPGFATPPHEWTLPATPASWVDTSVAASTTYYYRIRSENSNSYSEWSNTATVTVGP